MVCVVLGCKVARVVGVMARAVAERGEVKWVCIKCMGLRFLAIRVLGDWGFWLGKREVVRVFDLGFS